MRQFRSLTDQELVTLAQNEEVFRSSGVAAEVLQRLAHHARHDLARNDLGRVLNDDAHPTSPRRFVRYNDRALHDDA